MRFSAHLLEPLTSTASSQPTPRPIDLPHAILRVLPIMNIRSVARIALHARPAAYAEPFLPSLAASNTSVSPFSLNQHRCVHRDRNRNRGVSALRKTGLRPRQTLSVKKEQLPVPVLDPAKRSKVQVDEYHGLWQFFHPDKKLLSTPDDDRAHGARYRLSRKWFWADLS